MGKKVMTLYDEWVRKKGSWISHTPSCKCKIHFILKLCLVYILYWELCFAKQNITKFYVYGNMGTRMHISKETLCVCEGKDPFFGLMSDVCVHSSFLSHIVYTCWPISISEWFFFIVVLFAFSCAAAVFIVFEKPSIYSTPLSQANKVHSCDFYRVSFSSNPLRAFVFHPYYFLRMLTCTYQQHSITTRRSLPSPPSISAEHRYNISTVAVTISTMVYWVTSI